MTKDEICGLLRQIHDVLAMQSETNQVESVAWKNAAIRLGEELSSVGPDGYYNMTAKQWLDWAMDQKPQGKNSLQALQRTWVGLTDDEVNEIYTSVEVEVNEHWDKGGTTKMFPLTLYKAIEVKLKEKNV